MKSLSILLVILCYRSLTGVQGSPRVRPQRARSYFTGLETTTTPPPPPQDEELRVICVADPKDRLEPSRDEYDLMLDDLCTDVLIHPEVSDWEYLKLHSAEQQGKLLRERYPKVKLHVTIPESHLSTTSPAELLHLVAYLRKMNAAGLDVTVHPDTNPGILLHVLLALRQQLTDLKLTLTLPDCWTELDAEIVQVVDRVHVLPSVILDSSRIADPLAFFLKASQKAFRKLNGHDLSALIDSSSKERMLGKMEQGLINLVTEEIKPISPSAAYEKFIRHWMDSGIPAEKLVVGLPSTIYSGVKNAKSIPQSRQDLCEGTNLRSWIPEHNPHKDKLSWKHPQKSWRFSWIMPSAVKEGLKRLDKKHVVSGVMLFDLDLEEPVNPVCANHKSLFVQAVRKAIHHESDKEEDNNKRPQDLLPEWKLVGGPNGGGRLGQILFYGRHGEEEFVNYFNVTDDESLLDSPVERIALGYNSSGGIFDIRQPHCDPSVDQGDEEDELLYEVIHDYKLNVVGGWSEPPPVLIFPDESSQLDHPVPVLITWFKTNLTSSSADKPKDMEDCRDGQWKRRLPKVLPERSIGEFSKIGKIKTTTTPEPTTTTTTTPEPTTTTTTEAPTTTITPPAPTKAVTSKPLRKGHAHRTPRPIVAVHPSISEASMERPLSPSRVDLELMKQAVEEAYKNTYDKVRSLLPPTLRGRHN